MGHVGPTSVSLKSITILHMNLVPRKLCQIINHQYALAEAIGMTHSGIDIFENRT
jgi:hypothetical protein